jgi:hypothetical protein
MNVVMTLILIAIAIFFLVAAAPAMAASIKDASLRKTFALPNGAATTYLTPGFDLGISTAQGITPTHVEWQLTAPALTTAQLPDAKTMKYSIMIDTVDPIDGSSTVQMPDVITQTGAGGAGAAAQTYRFRLPSTMKLANATILGVRAVGSDTGDASGASATLEALL